MKTIVIRLATLFIILSLLAIIGAIGFMVTEDLSFFDALYFTVVTISTVGYGDINPTSTIGKILAIVLVILGVAIFLGVVANATQLLVQRRQEGLRMQRIHTLIGLFFSELGNELLDFCILFDPQIDILRQSMVTDNDLVDDSLVELKKKLKSHVYKIDTNSIDIKQVKELLVPRGDLVVGLLENSSLNEHESFTRLLRAIFHLREELIVRKVISNLPAPDIEHLASDLNRIYPMLTIHWISYIHYLKSNYPYLYSLAVRINPFNPKSSAVIRK
ncbi:potassium channel family protein [Chloroflexota bacterium]